MIPVGRRVVIFVVVAAALAVLIGAAVGERGYLEVRRQRATYAEFEREVEQLEAANAALMEEIRALKTDPYVIEKLAREKLGYVRPGEVIYLFPPDDNSLR
ncbi:MAG: septum formation initiator family protein [Acidobacteriota bacterium]